MQSTSTRCQLLDLSFVQNKDANNFLSNLFSRHKLELENALETCLEVSGEFSVEVLSDSVSLRAEKGETDIFITNSSKNWMKTA